MEKEFYRNEEVYCNEKEIDIRVYSEDYDEDYLYGGVSKYRWFYQFYLQNLHTIDKDILKQIEKHRERMRLVKRYLCINKEDEVLEAGCEIGIMAVEISRASAKKIIAVDYSDIMLTFAKRMQRLFMIPNIKYIYADLVDLKDLHHQYQFTKITALELFEHIYCNEITDILVNFRRLLKDGGKLYISSPDPLKQRPFNPIQESRDRHPSKKSIGYMLKELDKLGFECEVKPYLKDKYFIIATKTTKQEEESCNIKKETSLKSNQSGNHSQEQIANIMKAQSESLMLSQILSRKKSKSTRYKPSKAATCSK